MEEPSEHSKDNTSIEEWAEKLFQHHMKACERSWRAGSPDAVNDALSYCQEFERPPPRWILHAVRHLSAQTANISDGPGAINTPLKRFDQHLIDYTRFDAVEELIERKDEFLEWGDDRAKTQKKRWQAVSDILAKTPAAGGPDAIRKSYLRVKRNLRAGNAGLYYLPKRFRTGVPNSGS